MSTLKILATSNSVSGATVTWESVEGVTYFLQGSTNLLAVPAFQTLATGIPGQPDTTSYTDTNAVGSEMFFYRVGVEW